MNCNEIATLTPLHVAGNYFDMWDLSHHPLLEMTICLFFICSLIFICLIYWHYFWFCFVETYCYVDCLANSNENSFWNVLFYFQVVRSASSPSVVVFSISWKHCCPSRQEREECVSSQAQQCLKGPQHLLGDGGFVTRWSQNLHGDGCGQLWPWMCWIVQPSPLCFSVI